ncbi:MAG: hypothetical protein D6719_02705 [Candidatus Dadabacteria bacterium]|nr:MAG: hypothetical protein D6719_02705 [Candidatus Dadabacteria bacterium]
MLRLKPGTQAFLYKAATDMPRGFDRLASMMQECMGCNPPRSGICVFLSRRSDRVKILYWDRVNKL